jgi:hypothetical protein
VKGTDLFATHNGERFLKLRLYGFEVGLFLPPVEAATIVLNYELNVRHGDLAVYSEHNRSAI